VSKPLATAVLSRTPERREGSGLSTGGAPILALVFRSIKSSVDFERAIGGGVLLALRLDAAPAPAGSSSRAESAAAEFAAFGGSLAGAVLLSSPAAAFERVLKPGCFSFDVKQPIVTTVNVSRATPGTAGGRAGQRKHARACHTQTHHTHARTHAHQFWDLKFHPEYHGNHKGPLFAIGGSYALCLYPTNHENPKQSSTTEGGCGLGWVPRGAPDPARGMGSLEPNLAKSRAPPAVLRRETRQHRHPRDTSGGSGDQRRYKLHSKCSKCPHALSERMRKRALHWRTTARCAYMRA
jgi:hypothetical protein